MSHVVDTMHLFITEKDREKHVSNLIQSHFQQISPAQIVYELKRYGLNVKDESVPFDPNWWPMLTKWATTLQKEWVGPNTSIYVLPARLINAICFQHCICLFTKAPIDDNKLRALLTHEYNHSCRLARFGLPETVEDYIILEGLAQWAVREIHGEDALDPWATQLTYNEALKIWKQVNLDSILDIYAVLFGEEAASIPSHFGYSLGYRLVEQYVLQNPCSAKKLLEQPTDVFWS